MQGSFQKVLILEKVGTLHPFLGRQYSFHLESAPALGTVCGACLNNEPITITVFLRPHLHFTAVLCPLNVCKSYKSAI